MENRTGDAGETNLLIATATEGTSVRAEAIGEGQVIVILHPIDARLALRPLLGRDRRARGTRRLAVVVRRWDDLRASVREH